MCVLKMTNHFPDGDRDYKLSRRRRLLFSVNMMSSELLIIFLERNGDMFALVGYGTSPMSLSPDIHDRKWRSGAPN